MVAETKGYTTLYMLLAFILVPSGFSSNERLYSGIDTPGHV